MAIFNSYVKLPEGSSTWKNYSWDHRKVNPDLLATRLTKLTISLRLGISKQPRNNYKYHKPYSYKS